VRAASFCEPCGQAWHPVWYAWWHVVGVPIQTILNWLIHLFAGNALAEAIGPFGVSVVLLTLMIKVILSPVFQYQIVTSRRVQAEQRRIAPDLAALRKKYRKDPQALNQATMALYREHGINPLAQMSGCLPALVQAPILIALYWVIFGAQRSLHMGDMHFLWIHSLTARASAPDGLFVLPLLAGLTTFVQTKMMTPPGGTAAMDPTQQAMTQNMTLIMPVFIAFISLNFPAALALYWVASNLFSIGQQYFITGWGSLSGPSWPLLRKGERNDERRDQRKVG
jgi:YidC/Oxa1 family membrane protein insertase